MNLIDRARIERTVWTLDTYVQALPGRHRKAIRQELRANLTAGAADGGVREAVRRLGPLRRLAVGYLENEYGDRPRPRWLRGALWTVAAEAVILTLAFVGHAGFVAGIEAAQPRPDGHYLWRGLTLLGVSGDATYVDGQLSTFGLSFALWNVVYLLAALVIGGRLWRLPGAWWRSRRPAVHDVAVG
jgi:hypothetical protein